MYIVFEGIIGTGKSTLSKKLYQYLKKKFPNKNVILTREPGGTEIAQKIRKVVQGTKFNEEMDPICEAYLYAASRAQALRAIVKPVLDTNGIVVADRSFVTSLGYQAGAREIGIRETLKINKAAIENFIPDLVIFLDLDSKIALKTRPPDVSGDRWEMMNEEFFNKVRKGYLKASKLKMFKGKWLTISVVDDAAGSNSIGKIEDNFNKILIATKPYIDKIK